MAIVVDKVDDRSWLFWICEIDGLRVCVPVCGFTYLIFLILHLVAIKLEKKYFKIMHCYRASHESKVKETQH